MKGTIPLVIYRRISSTIKECFRRTISDFIKNKTNSLMYLNAYQIFSSKRKKPGAFFRRKCEGFLMVETALAFPIFLCFISMVIFMMFQLDVQRKLKVEMLSNLRKASYLSSDEAINTLSALQNTRNLMKRKIIPTLLIPENEDSYVSMTVAYEYHSPYLLFNLPWGAFSQQGKVRKWVGTDQTTLDEELVYITSKGVVYHEDGNCTYLKPQLRKVKRNEVDKLRNGSGEKYRPCKYCKKKIGEEGYCYITLEGNRFHQSKSCWELERDIFQIPRSEVGNRNPCSKCKRGKSQ